MMRAAFAAWHSRRPRSLERQDEAHDHGAAESRQIGLLPAGFEQQVDLAEELLDVGVFGGMQLEHGGRRKRGVALFVVAKQPLGLTDPNSKQRRRRQDAEALMSQHGVKAINLLRPPS
jgi:hypothetical protein